MNFDDSLKDVRLEQNAAAEDDDLTMDSQGK